MRARAAWYSASRCWKVFGRRSALSGGVVLLALLRRLLALLALQTLQELVLWASLVLLLLGLRLRLWLLRLALDAGADVDEDAVSDGLRWMMRTGGLARGGGGLSVAVESETAGDGPVHELWPACMLRGGPRAAEEMAAVGVAAADEMVVVPPGDGGASEPSAGAADPAGFRRPHGTSPVWAPRARPLAASAVARFSPLG